MKYQYLLLWLQGLHYARIVRQFIDIEHPISVKVTVWRKFGLQWSGLSFSEIYQFFIISEFER